MTGAFLAVTGASGVGKDALLAGARELRGHTVHFPRRTITRAPGPGEESTELDEAAFTAARERGAFAVWWRAHGLSYGIPTTADDVVRAGGVVVANVSRGVVHELGARYARLVVVRVTVSEAVRAERLRARGREPADEVVRRLDRADPAPDRVPDHVVVNDGTVAEGAAALVAVIDAALQARPLDARAR